MPTDAPLEIELSPQAKAMLDEADDRWISEHGFDADNPLLGEISHAADLLRETPELGISYRRHVFGRAVRRLLLRSGWHLYYSYDQERGVILIVALWFATRGSDPG